MSQGWTRPSVALRVLGASAAALAAILAFRPGAGPARAAEPVVAVPADFVADPLYFFFDERYGDATRFAEAVLKDPAAAPELRRQVLVTIGTVRLAQKRPGEARAAFLEILAAEPTAELDRPERLPPPVVRLFYSLRDSVCTARRDELLAEKKLGTSIRTVAFGDLENNSIVKSDVDADHLCRGLVQVMIGDLMGATSLKVVDRQRLAALLQELDLNADPARMSAAHRVQLGQLTGAQSYLFGQFMQTDRNKARLDLRWVDTSTGEILLARGIEGRFGSGDDLFELEKRLLVELVAPQIQKMLDSTSAPADLPQRIERYLDGKRRALPRRDSYLTLVETTGQAVAHENAGDYVAADAAWQKVALLNPGDGAAGTRARSITAYRKASPK